jgi:hypothetical protein
MNDDTSSLPDASMSSDSDASMGSRSTSPLSNNSSQFHEIPPHGAFLPPAPHAPHMNVLYRQREASIQQKDYLYEEPNLIDPYDDEALERMVRSANPYFPEVPTPDYNVLPSSSLSGPPLQSCNTPSSSYGGQEPTGAQIEVQDPIMQNIILSMYQTTPESAHSESSMHDSRASQVFKTPVAHPPGYLPLAPHALHSHASGLSAGSVAWGRLPDASQHAHCNDALTVAMRRDASTPAAHADASASAACLNASAPAHSTPGPHVLPGLAPHTSSINTVSNPESWVSRDLSPLSVQSTNPLQSPVMSAAGTPAPPQPSCITTQKPSPPGTVSLPSLRAYSNASVVAQSQGDQILDTTHHDASVTECATRSHQPTPPFPTTETSAAPAVSSATSAQLAPNGDSPPLHIPATIIPTPPAINVLAMSRSAPAPNPAVNPEKTIPHTRKSTGGSKQDASPPEVAEIGQSTGMGCKRSRGLVADGANVSVLSPNSEDAPRRSGRSSIPSTRNSMANAIGGIEPRGARRR